MVRLDVALLADVRAVTRSRPLLAFLALQLLAAILFVARRGPDVVATVVLVWLGLLTLAFFAWWAGRHRLAHAAADTVPQATARATFALIGSLGMIMWGFAFAPAAGLVLVAGGLVGWIWAALRPGSDRLSGALLLRDPRPFLPLLMLIAVPKLAVAGPSFVLGAALALPSGIGQQLLYLVGLFAPLEALRGRPDLAAVAAALIFGLIHVPFVLDANHGDMVASVANVVLLQGGVGIIACLAFVRHRAVLPIGVAHALAIA